ncbi:MAG: glutamyl-tRNA reductase [Acidobacteria bacterium RIFCSPLOWO2_12_FULL_59_11]|nr:MAG: glutamyl-tRNA reductase [Acidobacteria bacterium RIFCSPLOWO2_12_FULL_59_11]
MNFCLVGLSHKTAPVEVRECLAIPEDLLPDALRAAAALPDIGEVFILSTCNRVEILARAETDDGNIGPQLADFLARSHDLTLSELQQHLYEYRQQEAIRHLFRVASSLDSMVIGESQVLGQVKAAYNVARATGTLGGTLEEVLTRSFAVAKRIRTETGIAASAVSVSYAAVELARKIFGTLEAKRILLIGAGKMSELAAKHLLHSGAAGIFVTNRTPERAQEMASLLQGRPIPFEQLLEYAAQCDILISSTAAPDFLIRKNDGQRLLAERKNRPIFLIDIAVPRNIDPEVNKLDNLFLYDIDDLEGVVKSNLQERLREAQRGEQITEQEVEKLMRRLKTLDVVPTIIDLQAHFEQVRQQELERMEARFGSLTPEQREAVEALTRGMVNKILHSPISHLKTLAQHPDGLKLVETVRRIFNLKH